MTDTTRKHTMSGAACLHRKYKLTCDEFNQLHDSDSSRCRICRVAEPDAPRGVLFIDHDLDLGYWAVRGLLCSTCNGLLGRELLAADDIAQYLADPWYVRVGRVDPEPMEPPTIEAVDPDVAAKGVTVAAALYQSARAGVSRARVRTVARAEWASLTDAVRVAVASGLRQNEIVKASGHELTREQVREMCFIRGRRIV